nr:AP-2 complex subunit alpha-2-like [Parasteatoda tepidariorum]
MKGMCGLSFFISDIKNCRCQEDEIERINRELANIRSKFKNGKTLNGYMKKKYVCKLIYIFLLGHGCNLGIVEAINLLASDKYSEKRIGYLFLSLVLNKGSNIMLLVHNAVKSDLNSPKPVHQNLALQFSANNANASLANYISVDVFKILFARDTPDGIKQSAILCLLQLTRINPEAIANDNIQRIVCLLSSRNLGIVTTVSSLLEFLAGKGKLNGFPCVANIVSRLHRLFRASPNDLQDYAYYGVQSPWVVVKLLGLLRKLSVPSESVARSRLLDCIELIFDKCQEPPSCKSLEHKNAKKAIIFETVLLIHHIKAQNSLIIRACCILDAELIFKDNNSRYLAMEIMRLLLEHEVSKKHFQRNLNLIKDFLSTVKDSSVKQKASDLLFLLCDKKNLIEIINNMKCYVEECGSTSTKEEVILKIAYLAEQFYEDPIWYVDTILKLLENYGAYIRQEICFRFIEIVQKTNEVHSYACKKMFVFIRNCSRSDENLVKVAGYILGEFGNLIVDDPSCDSQAQFACLQKHFGAVSLETKAFLLTTYMKFINMFPDLKEDVRNLFKGYAKQSDVEIQQRAIEYLKLTLQEIRPVFYETHVFEKLDIQLKPALRTKSLNLMAGDSVHKDQAIRYATVKAVPNESSKNKSEERKINWNSLFIETSSSNLMGKIRVPKANAINYDKISHEPSESKSYVDILANIFDDTETRLSPSAHNTESFDPVSHFICQNSGTVFENDICRITFVSEFNKNSGRFLLSYKNKSLHQLRNFVPSFATQNTSNLKLHMNSCASMLCAGEEIKQEIEIECLQEFSEKPALSVGFECFYKHFEISFMLPVTMSKFFEPISMDTNEFRTRWIILNGQELMKVFNAKLPMDNKMLVKNLIAMKMSVLPNVSQNLDDFYGAAIFHSSAYQIGVLYRLQSNEFTKQYRITIRANRGTVLDEIANLVETLI